MGTNGHMLQITIFLVVYCPAFDKNSQIKWCPIILNIKSNKRNLPWWLSVGKWTEIKSSCVQVQQSVIKLELFALLSLALIESVVVLKVAVWSLLLSKDDPSPGLTTEDDLSTQAFISYGIICLWLTQNGLRARFMLPKLSWSSEYRCLKWLWVIVRFLMSLCHAGFRSIYEHFWQYPSF